MVLEHSRHATPLNRLRASAIPTEEDETEARYATLQSALNDVTEVV